MTVTTYSRFDYPAMSRWLARSLVASVGGRYSAEFGIDVHVGDAEIERWFLAATLFGNRILARIAARTFAVFADAGLTRIDQARHVPREDLISLLDLGGYTRYDFRMAARLLELSNIVDVRYAGQAALIGRRFHTFPELSTALDGLPGWGPVTVRLFLREMRGVWPAAQPPLDSRAAQAARHLGLPGPDQGGADLEYLTGLADASRTDVRDIETALVRLDLAHHRRYSQCAGGVSCQALAPRPRRGQ